MDTEAFPWLVLLVALEELALPPPPPTDCAKIPMALLPLVVTLSVEVTVT